MTRSVLVTGSSSGIGRATAERFAVGGYKVFASMRDPAKGEDLSQLAGVQGWDLSLVQLDVTDSASVESALKDVNGQVGALDVLVNNAGLGMNAAVEDATDQEMQTLFDTNVFGAVRVLRHALPSMREKGSGTVANVSSMGGHVVWPFFGFYHATKWALEALTESLAMELEPFGIRVFAVLPGLVETSFNQASIRGERFKSKESAYREENRRWIDGFVELVPDNRVGPETAAAKIFEVAESDVADLHHTSDEFADMIVSTRKRMADAEWFDYFRGLHGLD